MTKKVIFISLNSEVDTDTFTRQTCTSLFYTKGLTITRVTSDGDRVELSGLENFLDVRDVTPLDKGLILERNKVFFSHIGDIDTGLFNDSV